VTGRPELCVGAIVRRRDTLLLVRRGREPAIGTWSVPGGRVERGETMAQAVERELAEETGLLGRCGRLVGWVERISDEHHFVIADFEVELEGEDEPRAGDDADEARFVPVDHIPRLELAAGVYDFLATHGFVDPGP
jgi:8-oxo-dGTP diphosphatase